MGDPFVKILKAIQSGKIDADSPDRDPPENQQLTTPGKRKNWQFSSKEGK
jgi:hypothetical protein